MYVVHIQSCVSTYTSHIILMSRRMWLTTPSNIPLCTAYIRIVEDIYGNEREEKCLLIITEFEYY